MPDTDLARLFEGLKQDHTVGCGRYVVTGEEWRCTCGKTGRDKAIDAVASQVAALLDERGAVLARAVEALRAANKYVPGVITLNSPTRAECWACVPGIDGHAPNCARALVDALLADPTGAACIAEHRAMVAELEARRVRLAMATCFHAGAVLGVGEIPGVRIERQYSQRCEAWAIRCALLFWHGDGWTEREAEALYFESADAAFAALADRQEAARKVVAECRAKKGTR